MFSNTFKKTATILFLGLLTVSAFFIRLENFKKSRLRSIDEVVYYRMGKQIVEEGLSGYNTIPYGKELAARGRDLPDYFFEPLFKHPPVFTFLVAASMKIFGENLQSAGYVSLLLSALMIPLIYFLGTLLSNRIVGIFSAILLWMDPVSIICSQKVWLDTPLAFFTLLSVVLFLLGLKRNQSFLFLASGVASGLATNTKYTGIFITFSIFIYTVLYQQNLLKRKTFWFSMILPFLLLLPWFYWNYTVYGMNIFSMQGELHSATHLTKFFQKKWILIISILGAGLIFLIRKNTPKKTDNIFLTKKSASDNLTRILSFLFVGAFIILCLPQQLFYSLQFYHIPRTAWHHVSTTGESLFYFGQLLEFSPLYLFSFIALLSYNCFEKKEIAVLRLSSIIILLFFILWGAYQSRYILPCIPFLITLTCIFIYKAFQYIEKIKLFIPYILLKALLIIFITYSVIKTYYLDLILSYPNNMCYF